MDFGQVTSFLRWFSNGQIHAQEKPRSLSSDCRHSYVHNIPILLLETVDVALFVGADPRKETSLLNARRRKAHLYVGLEAGLETEGAPSNPVLQEETDAMNDAIGLFIHMTAKS